MEELFHTTISETESIEPQIAKLLQAARNLDSIGFGLADKVLTFIIVMALLESMSTLKTILYNTRGADLTCDSIVHQILIDEQRHIRTSGLASTAFYAKAAKTTKRSNEKMTKCCAHCNFHGHDILECRKLKSQQESKAPSNSKAPKALTAPNTANVAAAQSENGDDSDNETIHLHMAVTPIHAMTTVNNHALAALNLTNKWIIDSGASQTMCLNHEWFHSFTVMSTCVRTASG